MNLSRYCKYCASPAKMNPCWYSMKNPTYLPGSYDPPCYGDYYDENQTKVERRFGRNFFQFFFIMFLWFAVMLFLTM